MDATRRAPPLAARIEALNARFDRLTSSGLYYYFQPVDELDEGWVHTRGERKLMLATYSYLGLLCHPKVVDAAAEALRRYGAGTHGVRILGGTLDLHDRLERRLATLAERDDAIVYTSGYVTNLATISTLVGPDDHVLSDAANHASIVDGCRLSGANVHALPHNDMEALDRALRDLPADVTRLVVADAVFSMDGDIYPLPEASAICRRHGALLMIDEAHSFGVLGDRGLGIEDHFGLSGVIDIKMGTLSKTLPGAGGFVAADGDIVRLLRHTARGFVFSAAMPPPVAAGLLAALDVLEDEGAARRAILRRNVERFIGRLREAGFDLGTTVTAIVPIMIGDDRRAVAMTHHCQRHGLFVLPVLPPAVAADACRLRVNVTASHTDEDIELAATTIIEAGRRVGLIEGAT